MKKIFKKIIGIFIAITTIVAVVYGANLAYRYYREVSAMNALKTKAIKATKEYLSDNKLGIGKEESLSTPLPILSAFGYLNDFPEECLAFSTVTSTTDNHKADIICGEPSEKQVTKYMVATFGSIAPFNGGGVVLPENPTLRYYGPVLSTEDWTANNVRVDIYFEDKVKFQENSPINTSHGWGFCNIELNDEDEEVKLLDCIPMTIGGQPNKDYEWFVINVGFGALASKIFTQNTLADGEDLRFIEYGVDEDDDAALAAAEVATIKVKVENIDRDKPEINHGIKNTTPPSDTGWFTENVLIRSICSDALSGIATTNGCRYRIIDVADNNKVLVDWTNVVNDEFIKGYMKQIKNLRDGETKSSYGND